jgi:hypothetical protein
MKLTSTNNQRDASIILKEAMTLLNYHHPNIVKYARPFPVLVFMSLSRRFIFVLGLFVNPLLQMDFSTMFVFHSSLRLTVTSDITSYHSTNRKNLLLRQSASYIPLHFLLKIEIIDPNSNDSTVGVCLKFIAQQPYASSRYQTWQRSRL